MENLRVSSVKEQGENAVVELAKMAASQSDEDDGQSDAEFYAPLGLSPLKTNPVQQRNVSGLKEPDSNHTSDTKFFHHLQSHRQVQRQSFSPPFQGVKAK